MLHGAIPFRLDESAQAMRLERERAGVEITYIAPERLSFRQWTGYEPDMNRAYLQSISRPEIPAQFHIEAATKTPLAAVFTVTVMQPYRKGAAPPAPLTSRWEGNQLEIRAAGKTVTLGGGKDFSYKISGMD
jgi:hypothetical protein